jgi:hypothetical protein
MTANGIVPPGLALGGGLGSSPRAMPWQGVWVVIPRVMPARGPSLRATPSRGGLGGHPPGPAPQDAAKPVVYRVRWLLPVHTPVAR